MKKSIFFIACCLLFFSSIAQKATDATRDLDKISFEEKKEFQKLLDSSNTFYDSGEYTKSLKLNIKILNKAFKLKNPYFIHQGYRYLAYDYLYLNDTILAMDINMPVKNGIEAAYEIREFNKTIPIIALTAVEIEEMKNNIYMSGMNDIIVKPYDISKFVSCIIKNLSEKEKSHLKVI